MANQKETRVVEILVNGVSAGATIRQLDKDARSLRAHINGLTPGTKDWVNATKALDQVKTRLNGLKEEAFGVSRGFTLFKNQFVQLTTAVVGGQIITSIFQKIAGFFPSMISGAAKLSDELADVMKTTGMTAREAEELNKQLGKIDTRTGRDELRQIAIVAGQLGIAKEDVRDFTEATDKLKVALGDEFTGGAEEITKVMGGLRNVFTDMKSADIGGDMLRIGNALNELGAAGMATGPVVADFANRIGGVGISLGLTSGEVLGLSAALQELNVGTERGGTAISKILLKMTSHTKEFAMVAGMELKEFESLVNTNLFAAFQKVAEGSQNSAHSATRFAELLDVLGIESAGASEVMSKLSGNMELLKEKVDLATTSLTGTDSIMAEFMIKNTNLAARVDKLKKAFVSLVTSQNVVDFVSGLVGVFGKLLNVFLKLPELFNQYAHVVILATGATLAYNASLVKATAVAIANTTAKLANIVATKAKAFWTAAVTTATAGYITATSLLTGKITLATAAQRLFNLAAGANPIGAIIAVITAVSAALVLYSRNTRDAIEAEKQRNKLHGDLKKATENAAKAQEELNDRIGDYSRMSKKEREDLIADTQAQIEKTKAVYADILARKKRMLLQAEEVTFADKVKAVLKGGTANLLTGGADMESIKRQIEIENEFKDEIKDLDAALKDLGNTQETLLKRRNAEADADKIAGESISSLREKIDLYRLALEDAVKGSEDFTRIQDKLNKAKGELAKFDIDFSSLKEEQQKKEQKEEKDHNKEMERIRKQEFQDTLDNLEHYYAGRRARLKKDLVEGKITKEQYDKEIFNLESDRLEKLLVAYQDYQENTAQVEEQIQDKRIQVLNETLQKQIEAVEKAKKIASGEGLDGKGKSVLDLAAMKQEGLARLQHELDMTAMTEEQKLDIKKDFLDTFTSLEEQKWDELAAKIRMIGDMVLSAASSIDTIIENREEKELRLARKTADEKKKVLDEELAKKKISEESYRKSIEKIDEEYAEKEKEIRRKQAERDKAIAIFQATINTAAAVVEALPNPAMAIIAGILGAAQIAAIASTPLPEFSTGGFTSRDGRPDEVAGVVHKREWVAPQWMVESPRFVDTIRMLETARKQKMAFAEGGFTSASPASGAASTVPASPAAGAPPVVLMDPQMYALLKEISAKLDKPFRGYIVYDDIEDAQEDLDTARNFSPLG